MSSWSTAALVLELVLWCSLVLDGPWAIVSMAFHLTFLVPGFSPFELDLSWGSAALVLEFLLCLWLLFDGPLATLIVLCYTEYRLLPHIQFEEL
ncbi:hypothetical protein PspLS_09670 [Pyricularia sp. CBS 133598]|nr:hypothetical protein PspLS_09670 [Pyricularia sp. CBS 133598]